MWTTTATLELLATPGRAQPRGAARATGIDPAAPVWGAPFRELAALYDGADPPRETLGVSAKFSNGKAATARYHVALELPGSADTRRRATPAPRGRAHGRCAQGAAARRRLARRACHGGAAASLRFRRRRGRGAPRSSTSRTATVRPCPSYQRPRGVAASI